MNEYRRDITHAPDSQYHWVELGPIPGYPAWHPQATANRYPFPTLAAANLFAANHERVYPGRTITVTTAEEATA